MVNKIYKCVPCEFVTKKLFDYNRHLKTKSHLNGINGTKGCYICDNCGKQFASRQTLYGHKKRVICKSAETKKVINANNDGHLVDKKNEISNEQIVEMLGELTKAINKLAEKEPSKNINNVINIQYVTQNYKDAPVIESMTEDEIKVIKHKPDEDLIDCLTYHQRHRTVDTYIARLITDRYKTDDPSQQSLWNSDSSRLHYLIMKKFNEKDKDWVRDKRGVIVVEKVIRPILNYVKKEINAYQKLSFKEQNKKKNNNFVDMTNTNALLGSIITEINDGVLELKILKHMAPNFYLTPTLIKKEEKLLMDHDED
jgi:hypothetical protein